MNNSTILSRVMKLQKDNIEIIHNIISIVCNQKSNIIFIDLGCNNGIATMQYAINLNSKNIYGVDIASQLNDSYKGVIRLVQADLDCSIPFKDNSADIIVSNQTIEHLRNLDNFILELKRVLKPGGFAIISTVNLSSLHSIAMICLTSYPTIITPFKTYLGNFLYGEKGVGHNWGFNRSILKDIARYFDFELVEIWGCGYYFVPRVISILLGKIFPYWAVYIGCVIKKKYI